MPDSVKFSELDTATDIGGGDLAALAVENSQSETGYSSKKATLNNLGLALNNGIEYTTALQTTSKKPIGAINELLAFILSQLPVKTDSGAVANFRSPLALPLISCKASITATETGTGAKSPSNPYVISGFTGANISHSDADTSDPTVYTFSWQTEAGTVYGGELDVINGKLKITHAIGSLSLSSVGWHEDANRAGVFYCGVPVAYGRKNASKVMACSCFNATNTSPNTTNDLYISGMASYSGSSVFFRNSAWTGKTSQEINTLLENETFVYELATPIEYDLTPQAITALIGENNIWSDTGDMTVEYKQSIPDAIAEAEALALQ